jgi:hypothetical protein
MECPTLFGWLDFIQGRLSTDESTEITAHLTSGCHICIENHAWVQEVLRLAAEDKFKFSEEQIQEVLSLFSSRRGSLSRARPQYFARLVFDSFTADRAAYVRSESTESPAIADRQMLFQAHGYDIDLRIEKSDDSEDEELIGQILSKSRLPAELSNLSAWLLKGGVEIAKVKTNARGIFNFASFPAGVHMLRIEVPEGEINICDLTTARAS